MSEKLMPVDKQKPLRELVITEPCPDVEKMKRDYSKTPIRLSERQTPKFPPGFAEYLSNDEYTQHLLDLQKNRDPHTEETMEAYLKTMGLKIVKHG